MWPRRTSVSGSRSSVQNAARSVPWATTLGASATRSWLAEPWRRNTHIPLRRFSSASCERRRLVVGLDAGGEVRVERRTADARAVAVDAQPTGRGDPRQHLRIAGDHAREVHDLGDAERAVAFDHLGDVGGVEVGAGALELRGRHAAGGVDRERDRQRRDRLRQRLDARRSPSTLASSCGSAATAVVPSGSTVATNSSIHSFVDSRCMCASMKPGVSAAPSTSTTSSASRSPHPAITPSAIASEVSIHSRVASANTRPPVISRSAGSSPRATASARGDAGGRAIAALCHSPGDGARGAS